MKKYLTALAVALGLVVAGAAAPAFAHHTTLSHTVTCDTTTWTWTVTLNVANSEADKVMTITSVTPGNPLVMVGDTVDKGDTRVYTLTGVTSPDPGVIDIDVSWPNGVTAHGHDELLVSDYPSCVAPTPTPTPTPTVTPTPTPTPTSTPSTPPTEWGSNGYLAPTGPNPLAIALFFFGGLVLIGVGTGVVLALRPRKPKSLTKE